MVDMWGKSGVLSKKFCGVVIDIMPEFFDDFCI